MTVGVPSSNGATCMCAAEDRQAEEHRRRAAMPMTTSVLRAFFHSGFRNAGTPLEIASTPVTAAPPEAKACSTTKSAGARSSSPSPPCRSAARPSCVVRRRSGRSPNDHADEPDAEQHDHVQPMKKYVGTAKSLPDSLTPRRLPKAMSDDERRPRSAPRRAASAGERRRERGGAGGDRHRDGEDVVGEQRDAGDLRGQQPEVVAGDDVGAAGRRVGLDRLRGTTGSGSRARRASRP